jgi:hypothetical protein
MINVLKFILLNCKAVSIWSVWHNVGIWTDGLSITLHYQTINRI